MEAVRIHSAMMRGEMLAGGIVLLRLSGLVTADAHQRFAAEGCARWGHEARGFIVDYRGSALAATADGLGRMMRALPQDSPIRRPGAFVCDPAALPVMRAHALRCARGGLWRRTFLDIASAHEWVQNPG